MNILVSILVPIYNVENFIEKCSVSLFEQTYKNIEYVFVNDCSPDHSIEVLEKVAKNYPNRINSIKIINHDINKGLAGARNTAILNANGDYVLHVDSDDFIEKTTIEKLVKKAQDDCADIVVFDYYLEWQKVNKKVVHNFDPDKIKYLDIQYEEISKYQTVDFDLSIIVDKNVSYFEIEKVIKDANMQYLKSYSLIDVYENEEKLKDKKNITIRFNIGSSDKTLTKEEIDEERIKLITNLGKYNMNING